ncbi:MAG: nicotinamide riboside transporter PnuC [Candidatus Eremiobacterota bacterium]
MSEVVQHVLAAVTVTELIAFVLITVNVWLTVRQNVLCWPVGAVGVIFYFVVFLRARLYADASLQVVYFVLQFYGWYQWLFGGRKLPAEDEAGPVGGETAPPDSTELKVTHTPPQEAAVLAVLTVVLGAGIGSFMNHFTNAAAPYVDATQTSLSLAAQWMMARKYLESWSLWILVNVISVPLYLSRQLYPTTVLYAILLVMAILGYYEWKRTMRDEP